MIPKKYFWINKVNNEWTVSIVFDTPEKFYSLRLFTRRTKVEAQKSLVRFKIILHHILGTIENEKNN